MKARLIKVIEVSQGSLRRYFGVDGEPLDLGLPAELRDENWREETPVSAEDVIASVPRRRGFGPPPFDPRGPRLDTEARKRAGDDGVAACLVAPGGEP